MDSEEETKKEEAESSRPAANEWESPREPLKEGHESSKVEPENDKTKTDEVNPDTDSDSDIIETNLPPSRLAKFKSWYLSHKKISIPATVALVAIVTMAIPLSRHAVAAVFISHDIQVLVTDSETGSPVSEASVTVGSNQTVLTNGTGLATVSDIKPGSTNIKVTKKYYDDSTSKITIGVMAPKASFNISMKANGRAAKIKVVDLISRETLAGTSIKVADIEAETDEQGEALVVLPVGQTSHEASITASGYNDAKVALSVSDTGIEQNDYELTPAGQVYFLSNRSGRLDVMKSNLDGSDAKVVLAGTGQEDENNTTLIASADWKYLGLLARREGKTAKVHIITTSDDKLSTVDESAGDFTLTGWIGSSLVYSLKRSDVKAWQTGSSKLKSYDAASGKTTTLNQTSGEGDINSNIFEYYKFIYLASSEVVYAKGWTTESSEEPDYSGKRESIASISPDGQNPKTAAEYDAATKATDYTPHSPNSVYIQVSNLGSDDYEYFDYNVGSSPVPASLNFDQFYRSYPVYYRSADANQTLWTEQRDGKNAILAGNRDGTQEQLVANLDEYFGFGWFSDKYILLNDGERLSIISRNSPQEPIEIGGYFGSTYFGTSGYWYVY